MASAKASGIDPKAWLEHLEQHVPIALEGKEAEGIHQVRVAGRRLRVWLELGGFKTLEKDLQWMVRTLGPARDGDVLLATPVGKRGPFASWLKRRRVNAYVEARTVLDSPRLKGVLLAIHALPHLSLSRARKRTRKLEAKARRAIDAWEAMSQESSDVGTRADALHTARRAIRKLRYAREWLGDDVPGLSALQTALGAVCDVAALRRTLLEWSDEEGVALGPKKRLDGELSRMLDDVTESWSGLSRLFR